MEDPFEKHAKWLLAVWGTALAFVVAFWVGIVYIIIHFASKWW